MAAAISITSITTTTITAAAVVASISIITTTTCTVKCRVRLLESGLAVKHQVPILGRNSKIPNTINLHRWFHQRAWKATNIKQFLILTKTGELQ